MTSRVTLAVAVYMLMCCTFPYIRAQQRVIESVVGDTNVRLTFIVPSDVPTPVVFIKLIQEVVETNIAFAYPNNLAATKMNDLRFNDEFDVSDRKVTLTLKSVTTEVAGLYECFQSSTDITVEGCGMTLLVIRKPDPPVVALAEGNGKVTGDDLVILCQPQSRSLPQGHGLSSIVEWQRDPEDKINSDRITTDGNKLTLKGVRREDKDTSFRCRSMDKAQDVNIRLMSEFSDSFMVVPEFGPTSSDIRIDPPTSDNSTVAVVLGYRFQRTCNVTCQPACTVFWEFKPRARESFMPLPTDSGSGGFLDIRMVERRSDGVYRCVGENDHGRVERVFHLNVYYMLTPASYVGGEPRDRVSTHEGDGDMTIRCDLTSNPMPSVSWSTPDHQALNPSPLQGPNMFVDKASNLLKHKYTSTVVLRELKCSDSGDYQCKSYTQEIGSMVKNITVEVKCRPRAILEGPNSMKKNYVWELPKALHLEFLVESWPKPRVKSVESMKDGVMRRETLSTDVQVYLQDSPDRKPYHKMLEFKSLRKLTLEDDDDREFIITLTNPDYEQTRLKFAIRARGPPQLFTNLTVDDVSHSAVHLSWLPGFNGGETQTFSVFLKRKRLGAATATATSANVSQGRAPMEDWVPIVEGLSDPTDTSEDSISGQRVRASVDGLTAGSRHLLKVVAFNALGNTSGEVIVVTTLAAPSSAMSGGAIAAIVIVVLLIVIIVAGVLFYVFVYRKRRGKGPGRGWKPPVPSKVRAVYSRFKVKGHRNGGSGGSGDGGSSKVAPKESRPIFLGGKKKGKDGGKNVPTESSDPTLIDDDYANANDIKAPMLGEPIYANTLVTGRASEDLNAKGDEGKTLNEDGLHYASLDFSHVNPKKGGKKAKRKEDKPQEEETTYSAIDVKRTKAKQLEMEQEEEERRRMEEERQRMEEERQKAEEEDPYQVVDPVPGTAV